MCKYCNSTKGNFIFGDEKYKFRFCNVCSQITNED